MIYTNLLNTNAVEINDMTVGIEFPKGITPFGKTVLENPENKMEISNQVSIACGKTMQIKYIDTSFSSLVSQVCCSRIRASALLILLPQDIRSQPLVFPLRSTLYA